MKQIWKYVLTETTILKMPKGAQLLSVDMQGDDMCMWSIVPLKKDTGEDIELESRKIMVFQTGCHIEDSMSLKFIDTVKVNDGALMFHVFEVLDK